MRRPLLALVLGIVASSIVGLDAVRAQGVQAIRGLGESEEEKADSSLQASSAALAEQLGFLREYYQSTASVTGNAVMYRGRLAGLIFLAEEALRQTDYDRFRRALKAYSDAAARFADPVAPGVTAADVPAFEALSSRGILGVPIPGIHILVPDVVFTIGPEALVLKDAVFSIGVSTNLIGSAIGSAFNVLGSDRLSEYFKNNVSAGTAVPTGGDNKLTAQIGLGLGGVRIGGITFWPVINIEQSDTADTRTPSNLVTRDPSAGSWSSLMFTVAVFPLTPEVFKKRVAEGRLVPIITLGVRMPYFYASDPFSTLAALFTKDRSKFEKAGVTRFMAGVTIPLLRIK